MSKRIEEIISFLKTGDDVGAQLAAFDELKKCATLADLPTLIAEVKSETCGFWVRELLAEPICELGGPSVLLDLLLAYNLNLDEGHDNDSFSSTLDDLAFTDPEGCTREIDRILSAGAFLVFLLVSSYKTFKFSKKFVIQLR